jgi:amino acid adenylation domain-containing protein
VEVGDSIVKEKGGIKLKDFRVFDVTEIPVKGNRVGPSNEFLEFKKEEIQQSIVHRFESQVKMYPHKAAVRVDDGLLTYDVLNSCSNRVARQVLETYDDTSWLSKQEKPGKKDRPLPTVALLFGHNIEMIIGIMGVLKAGKVYVPLDATYPLERLEFMLEDSDCRVIVTDSNNMGLAVKLRDNVNKLIPIINVNDTAKDGNISKENPDISINPRDLAYILYTSGSTGVPKGVMQNHRNVLHFARVYTNALHIHSEDRLTLFSSYSFDAAKMDIYGALLNGAALYPYDIKRAGSLDGLPRWLQNEKLTIFHSIPTVYRYFMDVLPSSGEDALPGIRLLVMGGEAVYKHDVDRYKRYFPGDCLFINGLGPTESTVTVQYFIDKHTEITRESVPVGFPTAETEVYLINEHGREAQVFEIGEIVFKSDYLALGYLNHPKKTRQVFTTDPLTGSGRVYLTGDLGRRLPDGTIEFVGRKDFQVKVRGYRVELGEIEARLLNHAEIKSAVALVGEKGNNDKYLCAYFVAEKELALPGLKEYLAEVLPDYMVPTHFMQVKQIPLTPNGKIDGKRLPSPEVKVTAGYAAPKSDNEKVIADTWKEVLEVGRVGLDDNFFELGGTSIDSIRINTRLKEIFEKDIPVVYMFKYPTVRSFARYLQQEDYSRMVRRQAEQQKGKSRVQKIRGRKKERNQEVLK